MPPGPSSGFAVRLREQSERDSEPELSDQLFGVLEVARVLGRPQEVRVRRRVALRAEVLPPTEAGRVDRVEQVEDLADCLQVYPAAEQEDLGHAEVQHRERRAA